MRCSDSTTAPVIWPRPRRSSGGHPLFTSLTTRGPTTGTGTVTKADLAAGRIPLVNWEPHKIDFTKIVDGSLDATIVARANGSKALGKKFFLDFAAEMNGDEAWGGNNAPLYVAAYRHIHDIFLAAGATNVIWAWCPNVTDIHGGNKHTMEYYPGDAYVDWTGVDGYNWGATNGGWQTFQQVFREIYPLLAAKKKPILIGETSSAQVGGDKGKWIDEIIPTLRASFPLIKCLVWFDINKEADWRISSSPESEAAFIRMARDPYFNPQDSGTRSLHVFSEQLWRCWRGIAALGYRGALR